MGVALVFLGGSLAALATDDGRAAASAPSAHNYAQHLLEGLVNGQDGLLSASIEATPPGRSGRVTVAATAPAAAPPADRITVSVPLLDVSGNVVGGLNVVYGAGAGGDRAALRERALALRASLARRISNVANLLEPYPFDPRFSAPTRAQQLVDETLARNPELEIFALHATPPGGSRNVIIASNIGRIGKPADEDDLRVVRTGMPNLEVNDAGNRFEVEMPLRDRSGRLIGAVSTVFAYHPGDDKAALRARGEAIAADLATRIPDAASLFRPATDEASAAGIAAGGDAPVLVLKGRTELPGYSGDFDHLAVDLPGRRLFLAAEDHATLEVFDLDSMKHLRSVGGFETPHSIFPIPGRHRLLVTDGSAAIKVLDDRTFAPVAAIRLHPGADSIAYDDSTGHLYVVTGGKDVHLKESWLEEIDPSTGKVYGAVHFDADHVEALAVEQHGSRLFINVTDRNELDVIDKASRRVVARWPIREAQQNALVQLDESTRRLFVVTRKPGRMLVLDSGSGATLANFSAPGRVDGESFDAANHRVYAPGGEGYLGVYLERDADHFSELAPVASAPGAKTALLVPELQRLYVAISPGEAKSGGGVLWFEVIPAH